MFKRFVFGTAGIVAAVGGPAALFNVNHRLNGATANPDTTVASSSMSPGTNEGTLAASPLPTANLSAAPAYANGTALPPLSAPSPSLTALAAGPTGAANEPVRVPSVSIAEAFNLNATPEWIAARWPRVSNGLAQLNLQGYRVPLVTGTSVFDVAGSLSYYFDPLQHVDHLAFQGTTGDPRELVGILSQRFQLFRRLTNDPGLIIYESPRTADQPVSWLRIRPAAILQASDPLHRFDVDVLVVRSAQ